LVISIVENLTMAMPLQISTIPTLQPLHHYSVGYPPSTT